MLNREHRIRDRGCSSRSELRRCGVPR
jgi:hypothetical protein